MVPGRLDQGERMFNLLSLERGVRGSGTLLRRGGDARGNCTVYLDGGGNLGAPRGIFQLDFFCSFNAAYTISGQGGKREAKKSGWNGRFLS